MGFFLGIRAYGKAFELLFSRKFWWFLFFPVLILLFLFIGGNILVSYAGDNLYGLFGNQLRNLLEGIRPVEQPQIIIGTIGLSNVVWGPKEDSGR